MDTKFDYSNLKGLIRKKLGSDKEFAKAINRTPQFVSMVFCHKTYFSMIDILRAIDVLEIDPGDIKLYFFTVEK